MELALNILWLLIAVAGVILWRTSWTHQSRTRRHAPWREWTALACALVLLFFVVSLTDDLHAELVVLEDCTNCRRHVNCHSAAQHPPRTNHFPAGPGLAVLPALAQATDFAAAPLFLAAANSLPSLTPQQSHSGRAPPLAI